MPVKANKVLILNGPNLNMLGVREPAIYGKTTLKDIEADCKKTAKTLGLEIAFKQSNDEGTIVSEIQKSKGKFDYIILNAAAYTHTSIAIHDAIKASGVKVLEVHLSNIYKREEFRHKSYISPLAEGVICGFGKNSYTLALNAIKMGA
jgi:3-dehydroquinate dehydratase-2